MKTREFYFDTREQLDAHLVDMNYEHGINPELACIDDAGAAFLACGTEQGDCMGIAYYVTNAEGYMYHYGTEWDADDEDLLTWVPTFPVRAIGVAT